MTTVQVLCPNGRRQNVKITPNTKLLQVLEEVCKKQGFLPPEDYNLIHGRKTLDVTLSLRYANLPNNCKLELIKSEKSRIDQEVIIALQLENGERLQGSFSPNTTLWDLLQHWESKSENISPGQLTATDSSSVPPTHPVCIYMREEVIGEMALQSTSLRKLGLTGGKAALRVAHRPVDDGVMAEIISKLEKEQLKNARLEQIAARQNSQTESVTMENSQSESKPNSVDIPEKETKQTGKNFQQKTSAIETSDNDSAKSLEPMDTESCEQLPTNPSTMDVDPPVSAKNNQLSIGNGRNSRNNGQVQPAQSLSSRQGAEALRNMNIPGIEVITPDDFHNLTPQEQQVARQMAAAYFQQIGMDVTQLRQSSGVSQPRLPARPTQNFQDFKFPDETKGKDLYVNEKSSVNKEEYKPCDRETLIFSMDEEVRSPSNNQELPDDFFEVTEQDIRKMMTDLQKKVECDQPLMTQAMRMAKIEEQYSKYDRVVIRIQFPDKLVLQGLFRPRETVFAVKKYVKSYLENKDLDFYLYTVPPKQVLKDNAATMIESKLAPASVVYFGVDESKVCEHYLSQAVLKEVGPRLRADEVVGRCFPKDETDPPYTGAGGSGTSKPVKRSQDERPRQPRESSGQQPGVPKWFKMGKK